MSLEEHSIADAQGSTWVGLEILVKLSRVFEAD
jgi:hypothetical protein